MEGAKEGQIVEQLKPELELRFSGKTVASPRHPERNEDAIGWSEQSGLAMVLDGVGGQIAGDRASRIARNFVNERLRGVPLTADPESVKQKISSSLIEASRKVTSEVSGGGTTATVVKMIEYGGQKRAIIGHVGDSRAYVLRGTRLIQITEDDSILATPQLRLNLEERRKIGEKLDQVETRTDLEKLSHEEEAYYQQRNIITQMLGDKENPNPHIYHVALAAGDKLILTSDGVHDNLSRREIEQIVKSGQRDLALALVERATARSGEAGHVRSKQDDISAVVIEVSPKQQPQIRSRDVPKVVGQPEVARKQGGEGELTPEETLRRARLFLELSQAQKAGRNVRWDDEKREVSRIIQERLRKGETIDQVSQKSAANLKGLLKRYSLKVSGG